MKDNAITGDELIEQMKPLGNKPVVFLGSSGAVRNAIRQAVLVDSRLIGLVAASTQTNVGDVLTTQQAIDQRDKLRLARQSFAQLFTSYIDDETISKRDFRHYKNELDSVIDKTITLLDKLISGATLRLPASPSTTGQDSKSAEL